MMKKWFSLLHWRRTGWRALKLLVSKDVALADKLWYGVPLVLYWVLPDLLPFNPLDDAAVTLLWTEWFVRRMNRKIGEGPDGIGENRQP